MVELRSPRGGQLVLLALIPSLLAYHAVFGETAPSLALVAYAGVVFVTLAVALVVDDGVRSPWYLLVVGTVTLAFGGWRALHDGARSSLLMSLSGAGILLWGVLEYRSPSTPNSRDRT